MGGGGRAWVGSWVVKRSVGDVVRGLGRWV